MVIKVSSEVINVIYILQPWTFDFVDWLYNAIQENWCSTNIGWDPLFQIHKPTSNNLPVGGFHSSAQPWNQMFMEVW